MLDSRQAEQIWACIGLSACWRGHCVLADIAGGIGGARGGGASAEFATVFIAGVSGALSSMGSRGLIPVPPLAIGGAPDLGVPPAPLIRKAIVGPEETARFCDDEVCDDVGVCDDEAPGSTVAPRGVAAAGLGTASAPVAAVARWIIPELPLEKW